MLEYIENEPRLEISKQFSCASSKKGATGLLDKKRSRAKYRRASGAAIVTLLLVVGMVLLPLFGLFSFEIGRSVLAIQQLQHALDAAALTAACSLSSQDDSNPVAAHQNAVQAALTIFKKNTILGKKLTDTTVTSSFSASLPDGKTEIIFEFQDALTKNVVPAGDPRGKIVRASGCTNLQSSFGNFLGLNRYNLSAVSSSMVPKLDIIICFDVSGSIDDQTPVTCSRRKWSASKNKITYDIPTGTQGPASNKIYDMLAPESTGSSLNGLQPQNLDEGYFNAELNFSEYLAKAYGVSGLRALGGYPDQGKPPGNYPPGNAPTFDGFGCFTDMVVNIDGNKSFSGYSYKGYEFPDLATLVEASRGNLENTKVFNDSKANTSVSVSPKNGYMQAYQEAARKVLQPINDATEAAKTFADIMNINTQAHFGFISFDATVGNSPSYTHNWFNIDEDTQYGVNTGFPQPRVIIDKASDQTKYSETKDALGRVTALGATNIGLAVHEAVKDFKNGSRTGATKAIILFTDGQPTIPGGPLDADPMSNARKAAQEASSAGIPIYTIGLATNSKLLATQYAILNDVNSNPGNGGIAAIAGHGGTFQQVTDSKDLRRAFEKIARSLTRLIITN